MIKHIVIWPTQEDVTMEQKMEVKTRLEALQDSVDELAEIEVGIDEANGTMSLYSLFNSDEDLDAYQAHPAHQAVLPLVKAIVAGRSVCDYEV